MLIKKELSKKVKIKYKTEVNYMLQVFYMQLQAD
jgi:hypothetical protein